MTPARTPAFLRFGAVKPLPLDPHVRFVVEIEQPDHVLEIFVAFLTRRGFAYTRFER